MVGEKNRKTQLNLIHYEMGLKVGRDTAVEICKHARPTSDTYRKASTLLAAIDDLAVELGGQRDHFHAKPHSSNA